MGHGIVENIPTHNVNPGEAWWPCIVCVTGASADGWPFYCLALAWVDARAWGLHGERVRSRPGFQPQLLASTKPPPPPSVLQLAIDTPTTAHSTVAATSGTSSGAVPSEMSSSESDDGTAKSGVSDVVSEADWDPVD